MFDQALQIFKPLWYRRLVSRRNKIPCQTNEIKPNKHREKWAFHAPIFFNYFKSFLINLNAFKTINSPFIILNQFSFFYILINKSYGLTLFQKLNTKGVCK